MGVGKYRRAIFCVAAKLEAHVAAKGARSAILGDVDGDGAVTVADALAILRVAARLA